MALYGKLRRVNNFVYRKIFAEIFHALQGANHCDLDHEPDKLRCEACGEAIIPKEVWLVHVSGQDVGIACDSAQEAEEIAKAFIDDQIEPPDEPEAEPPDDKKEERRDPRSKERDAKHPLGGGDGHKKLVAASKQLGWGKRLAALLAKRKRGST